MTTMQAELYDALLSAGADEAKARRAAEAAADHEHGFERVERRIDALQVGLERRIDGGLADMQHRISSVQMALEKRIDSGLSDMQHRIDGSLAELSGKIITLAGEMTLMRWMLGVVVGGVVALVIKAFF